jgi:hypothetical protein
LFFHRIEITIPAFSDAKRDMEIKICVLGNL